MSHSSVSEDASNTQVTCWVKSAQNAVQVSDADVIITMNVHEGKLDTLLNKNYSNNFVVFCSGLPVSTGNVLSTDLSTFRRGNNCENINRGRGLGCL